MQIHNHRLQESHHLVFSQALGAKHRGANTGRTERGNSLQVTEKQRPGRIRRRTVIERDFTSRRQGVRIREDATEEELRLKDLPYAIGAYKECTGDNIKKIKNPNSLEGFKRIIDEEYEQEGELSFNERYYVGDKVNLQKRIVSSLENLKSLRKNKEEEQK